MHDERGLVGKAAVTIMVLIVLIGLAAIDGGSILVAELQISDTADAAATAAEESYASNHNAAAAKQAGVAAAHERDPDTRISTFVIHPDGSVTLTVRKRASTIFVRHIGFLKHFAAVSATSTVSP